MRRGDGEVDHRLHLRVGDELGDRESPASGDLGGDGGRPVGVEVGDRDDAHAVQTREGVEVLPGDDSQPDYADSVRLAHSRPLSMMVRTLSSWRTSRLCPGVATKMRPLPHSRVHTAGEVTGRCHGW